MARAEVTYHGPPALASLLVSMLREEGAEVEWEPPVEQRGLPPDEAAVAFAISILAAGSWDGIKLAVAKFRERRAEVRVEVERLEGDDQE